MRPRAHARTGDVDNFSDYRQNDCWKLALPGSRSTGEKQGEVIHLPLTGKEAQSETHHQRLPTKAHCRKNPSQGPHHRECTTEDLSREVTDTQTGEPYPSPQGVLSAGPFLSGAGLKASLSVGQDFHRRSAHFPSNLAPEDQCLSSSISDWTASFSEQISPLPNTRPVSFMGIPVRVEPSHTDFPPCGPP